MLLTPTLALLSIIFNFCALLHLTSDGNGLSRRRWHALDRAIYALEEATVTAYENYLDILAPPPLTSSPAYFSPLRHAEWVYRSSAVRILDLVDGSSRVKLVSDVASPSLLLPSPPIPTNPVASVDIIPPTLTLVPLSYPATLEQFPTYNASTPLVAISSVTRFLEFAGLSCLGYLLVFAWMKNRYHHRRIPTPKPTLTCDVHCQIPVEDFHSVNTATSIPSYPGTEADLWEEDSSSYPYNSHTGSFTTPRTFPVAITGHDGQALFKADLKVSSDRIITELSATSSTVSFSVDVVASLDIQTVPEWYVPAKEENGTPYKAEDSLFLLLVRGLSDRISPSEDSHRTPKTDVPALGLPECELEDLDIPPLGSPLLGSPMCPVTIPFHYRGFSAFETALINSGTKTRRDKAHKKGCSHRARNNVRPRDVPFAWLKDIYQCGDSHLNDCPCEDVLAEHVLDEQHPHPQVLSKILHDHDATPETDWDTHSEEGGSGMCKQAPTVSPGLSAQSEMSPTDIFGLAGPRPTARSDPSFADGKELAGLDSTVALMPSFGVVSPELPPRRRSSGIPTPAEFSDGTLGEQSMSLEEVIVETGFTFTSKPAGMTHLANGSCSPPSPAAPGRVNLLMDALEPILANHCSSPSPKEATLIPPPPTSRHLEYSPLQYSPASVRSHSPAKRAGSPEYDEWVGGPIHAVDDSDLEPASEVEPPFPFYRPQEMAAPSTPPRR